MKKFCFWGKQNDALAWLQQAGSWCSLGKMAQRPRWTQNSGPQSPAGLLTPYLEVWPASSVDEKRDEFPEASALIPVFWVSMQLPDQLLTHKLSFLNTCFITGGICFSRALMAFVMKFTPVSVRSDCTLGSIQLKGIFTVPEICNEVYIKTSQNSVTLREMFAISVFFFLFPIFLMYIL